MKMYIFRIFLLISLVISITSASKRSLKAELNPGCVDKCNNYTTFHLEAEGSNDVIHYLWDFVGRPSVLVAVTSKTAKLNIDWTNFKAHKVNSINFTEEPLYSFGLIVDKIIEFNDVDDTGMLNNLNESNVNRLDTNLFKWGRKKMINVGDKLLDKHFIELEMIGTDYNDNENNLNRSGTIEIILNGFNNLERSDVTPYMLHSENSTQIDFIFNNLQTNSTFSKSRFGVELLLISQGNPYNNSMFIDEEKHIDDEYTPGVFKLVQINIPTNNKYIDKAYLKWRDVSYLSSDRDMINSTRIHYYSLINSKTIPDDSIFHSFYGDVNYLKMERINVTIGVHQDGFYNKTQYATWTLLIGYGTPPYEKLSYLVIMIISIGIGLPGLILTVVAIYQCIRRIPKKRSNQFINS